MKFLPFLNASTARETTTALSPIKVSMHVLGAAPTDPRVMRAATALVEKGFAVSIVDIADKAICQCEEDIRGIHMRHIIMPSLFVPAHFKPWFLIKLAAGIIRETIHLLQIPADVYHVHSELDAIVEVIKTYDVGKVVPSLASEDIGAAINAMLADHDGLVRMLWKLRGWSSIGKRKAKN